MLLEVQQDLGHKQNKMIHTLVQVYLVANVFLTGTLWEDMKIQEYSFRQIIGFIGCFLVFTFFALPIFIISDVKEFVLHKKSNCGIDVTNFLYIIEKKFNQMIKFLKSRVVSDK